VIIKPYSLNDAVYVAECMREWNRQEWLALSWSGNPFDMARLVAGPMARVVLDGALPVAVFGASAVHPGVWQAWAFSTDEFPRVVRSLTKAFRRDMLPALKHIGAHRIEVRSLAGSDVVDRWLRWLGAERECTLRRYGRNGEDFHLYAWT
jgi:hypothetical protein